MRQRTLAVLAALSATLWAAAPAHAFCGFYVSGASGDLFNRATMVVLMRDGTRTVLSMRNNYDGPPQDFAMIVPVPVVLSEDDVKTLPHAIFDRVDLLAAPRLVEYWETDPCYVAPPMPVYATAAGAGPDTTTYELGTLGVTVEAQFVVGEYQIAILSAQDSSGLDTWLRGEGYNIPQGAGDVLRPYVQAGTKFFVARVDIERVERDAGGRARLSPLRVSYESAEFALPVRLGLLNSSGTQDLIVHVLSREGRFEVANHPNVTIPTNLVVSEGVRDEFGPFYVSLMDRLLEQHPRHVITEYAWDAMSCDPCPVEPLSTEELTTLGLDVVGDRADGFTLTRLHYRYTRETLGEDLVFRRAEPITGGRGVPDAEGHLSHEVTRGGDNNFQGRYAILNWWNGSAACSSPVRGRWGGPPSGQGRSQPIAATNTAFVTGGDLAGYLAQSVPALGMQSSRPSGPPPVRAGGCASCAVGATHAGAGSLLTLGVLALLVLFRAGRRNKD